MATSIADIDFCVVDTETTGGSPAFSRVIDIAVFHYKNGRVVEKYETLINPEAPIPLWISNLTGINDSMVARAPVFRDIAEPLMKFLQRGEFVAHNAPFDYAFIKSEFERVGVAFDRPKTCTVKLARLLYPELPSRSLGNLCEHLLIDIWDRHRASGDAEATVYVLKDLLRKAEREHGVTTWEELQALQLRGRRKISTAPKKATASS
jgi:DNA polymerase-3 subunit epsilon